MERENLRKKIVSSLKRQGFKVQNDQLIGPKELNKDAIRKLHEQSVRHQIATGKSALSGKESELLCRLASGREIIPERISPKLVEVHSNTKNGLLFRYATLHWSIPISTGYGRRLRFLVIDEQNDKLIGIIGLGDPVFNLGVRDKWIGWEKQAHQERLSHIMDAFVLGAVPPYSQLLCGKLVAMLAASNEVRDTFRKKYSGQESLISQKETDARLALITTASALGKSSLYNRLKYKDRLLFHSVGFTQGYGEFHFSNGIYQAMAEYAAANAEPTAKKESWGKGFRNRREVVRKCLASLEIKSDWTFHGIQREVFAVPLAHNTQAFLRGENSKLRWFDQSVANLSDFFKERWLLPRSLRNQSYCDWEPEIWRLW